MSLQKHIITESKKKAKIYSNSGIFIPIKIGDTILTGRFKNKPVVVETIGLNEHGLPIVNGRNIMNFRFPSEEE